MGKKTYDKKKDFIMLISSMTDKELNDYIKRNGSEPKKIPLCYSIDKDGNIIDPNIEKIQ